MRTNRNFQGLIFSRWCVSVLAFIWSVVLLISECEKKKNLRMLRWRDWVQVKADEIECKWQEPSSAFCLLLQSTRKTYDEREKKKIPKLRLTSHSPPWAHTHPDSFKLPLKLSCSTGNNQCFPRDKHYSCSHSASEQPANFPHIYSCLWSGQLDVALHLTSDHGRKCPYCSCY